MELHDLKHEFPEFEAKIHELKTSNHHFSKLFDDYHDVNHKIHGIESSGIPTTDEILNQMRKHRAYLKDALYEILSTSK